MSGNEVNPPQAEPVPQNVVEEQKVMVPASPKEAPSPASAEALRPKVEETKDATIRVDVNLLEKQMNLVCQLVLLRNRLLQLAAGANE
jgi:chemotaxis protein histidine kinase CheA